MPARSHPDPNCPPRSQPAVDVARAARCTEAIRDIAEDFVVRAEELLHQTHNPDTPATDLVVTVAQLARLTEEATAALVVRQRSQGEPLKELTPALGLTEDRLRKKYYPKTVDLRLASRTGHDANSREAAHRRTPPARRARRTGSGCANPASAWPAP
ncbi:hypothetical protein [Streptomyces rubiginosohelvolus]|uniref:hypothetical protein n=1 Tax=Streptomyces rubiginosohelvolus TaxID=67362 RepID=UPI0036E5B236